MTETVFEKQTRKQRLVALMSSGIIAATMLAMPAVALADNTPSAGTQTGTGTTQLTMITADDGSEHDETGANVSFTFPSSINYVVAADGTLTGPSGDAAYIDNGSNFKIHVSSIDVDAEAGWSFVEDIANATASNSVELNIGPSDHAINAHDYLDKTADVDNMPAAIQQYWQMSADGAASDGDKVKLASEGGVANVVADITSATSFGTITWYVKAGPALSS